MTAQNRAARIICLGECMMELSGLEAPDGRADLGVAGDTLNTAIYLARLLPRGTRVAYATALGPDTLSHRMVAAMTAEGIDTDLVARLPDRLPGIYAIELDPQGERRFHYWRQASAARAMFGPGGLRLSALDGAAMVYLSGITLAILPEADRMALIAHLAGLRGAGVQVVFDGNYRPRLWDTPDAARAAMGAMWRAASIALPSADDEAALWGDEDAAATLARIGASGVAEVAVKRGAEGPLLSSGPAGPFPPARRVVDTTAAGDSFNAGYLAARSCGADPAQAALAGHTLACAVIGARGAILPRDAMPTP